MNTYNKSITTLAYYFADKRDNIEGKIDISRWRIRTINHTTLKEVI
jgi:hypothetical protein